MKLFLVISGLIIAFACAEVSWAECAATDDFIKEYCENHNIDWSSIDICKKEPGAVHYRIGNSGMIVAVFSLETYTGISTTSDVYIHGYDADYNTAHNMPPVIVVHTGEATLRIGQQYSVVFGYWIYRSYVFFNTSSIGAGASIISGTLSFYGFEDYSYLDYDFVIQNGQPSHPQDPPVTDDYNCTYYSGNGGSFNTSSFTTAGYNNIALNSTGLSWINKTGTTKLCIRSNRDISSSPPTSGNDEWVVVYSREYGDSYAPRLVLTYSPVGIDEDKEALDPKDETSELTISPNPFCQRTEIRYKMQDTGCRINGIKIYDASGGLVKSFSLESCIMDQVPVISWSGDDDFGRKLPAGVYFLELKYNFETITKKIIMVE